MSHNINSMMYYGAKPWHKLGTEVKEVQTSEQAIISAGLKGNLGNKVRNIQDYLGIIEAKSCMFEEAARKLATVQVCHEAWGNYVKNSGLIPKQEEGEKASTRAYNIMEDVSRLFEHGKGQDMPGANKTAWGAFNAVVEYVDYQRATKDGKRAESLLFGSGANIKQRAWDNAVAMI